MSSDRLNPLRLKPLAAALLAIVSPLASAAGASSGAYFPPAEEIALYWDGPGAVASDWFHPYNWIPGHAAVPDADNVAVITGGHAVLDADATVLSFYQWNGDGGSTLSGIGTLHTGDFRWNAGAQSGSGGAIVAGGATLGFGMGYSTLEMTDGRFLQLNGETLFQSSWIRLAQGARIHNNGDFISTGDRRGSATYDNSVLSAGAGNAVRNNGHFTQRADGHTTRIDTAFDNLGTVTVESGQLHLRGGGQHQGSFSVLAGQTLSFAGAHTLSAGALLNDGDIVFTSGSTTISATTGYQGNGRFAVRGGSVSVAASAGLSMADVVVSAGTLRVDASIGAQLHAGRFTLEQSAALEGSAALHADALLWSSGRMSGTGLTRSTGSAALGDGSQYGALYLEGGRLLALDGNTTFQAAFIGMSGASVIENGGHFVSTGERRGALRADNSIVLYSGGGTFRNLGSFVQDAAGRTTTIQARFDNRGQVDVQSGTLKLTNGGAHTGSFNVSAGQTLDLGGGAHAFAGATMRNAGTLRISGGTTALDAGVAYGGGGHLAVSGGTLRVAQPVPIQAASLNLAHGTVDVNSALSASFMAQANGDLEGGGLLEAGQLLWNGGTQRGAGTTAVSGHADLGNGSTYAQLSLDGRHLHLTGTTTLQAFQLSMSRGAVLENDGVLTSVGDRRGTVHQDNVVVQHALGAPALLRNDGSFIQDSAGATTRIGVQFDNHGVLRLDSGRLVFDAAYRQLGDDALLDLGVGDLQFDSLVFNAGATFDGVLRLRLEGRAVQAGDLIHVFDYAHYAGQFDRIVADGLAPGLALSARYEAGSLGVLVTAVPEPASWALLLSGLGLIALAGTRGRRATAEARQ